MTTTLVLTIAMILVVSGALLVGAAWGIYGRMSSGVEGFVVAIAGGALLISAVLELVEPATEAASVWLVCGVVLAGAVVFTLVDYLIDEHWGDSGGGGLLAAITLDGVPENLALGVALIGAEPMAVAALAGSILLSNLPEGAGGAKEMSRGGRSNLAVFGLWAATAVLLAASALAGNVLLQDAPDRTLALVRSFAAGAVIASLATEVFPTAFRKDSFLAGVATAIGAVLAVLLDAL